MKSFFKKIKTPVWLPLDWSWRILIAASVAAAVISITLSLVLLYAERGRSHRRSVITGDILSAQLACLNTAALSDGRLDLLDIDPVLKRPEVKNAAIFNRDGRAIAPIPVYGRDLNKRGYVGRAVAGRSPVIFRNEGGELEVFRPVISAGPLKEVLGVVWLVLYRFGRIEWELYVFLIAVVVSGLLLLILWVQRETVRSMREVLVAGSGKRFGSFDRLISGESAALSRRLSRGFELEWRRLIHAASDPILILDRNLRLVELNGPARVRFGVGGEAGEGRHILDILKEGRDRRSVVPMLEGLGTESVDMIRSADGGISIFSSQSRAHAFKYTIMFLRG